MFCIKCGMRLSDSAKSCPACGTKMIFPEGFVPEQSTDITPDTIASSEPPHVPDDFDLSKANTSYNGKTILITDEPEIDLDMTMAAPAPKFSANNATEPLPVQPAYAPTDYAQQPLISSEQPKAAPVSQKKSKLPLVVAVAVIVLVALIAAILWFVSSNKNDDQKPSSPSEITESFSENQITNENESKPTPDEGLTPVKPDSSYEIVDSVVFITHYVVVNPNAADYAEIKQRINYNLDIGTFDHLFEADTADFLSYNMSFDSELTCYYPGATTSPFRNAGGLILTDKEDADINFKSLAMQNDGIGFVAESEQSCIAFVSYESDREINNPDVEFIPIYTDEIVIACESGSSKNFNVAEATIGICDSSPAYRYANIENNYDDMIFSEEQITEFETEEEMLEALKSKSIDCIITDQNHFESLSSNK